MRTNQTRLVSCLVLAVAVAGGLAPNAGATTYTWDAVTGGAITWGSGTWTTTGTGLNWNNGATWVNWPNSLSDTARFAGTSANPSEAITVNSGIQAGGITFDLSAKPNNYTVVLSGGDITLAAGATIIPGANNTGGFPEIGSVIHGGAINIGDGGAAVGRMVLSGANDYTGVTTIKSNSTVNIWNANALGAIGAGTVVENGGRLMLGGYSGAITTAAEPLTLNGTGVDGLGALASFWNGGTYAGPITVQGSAVRINNANGQGSIILTGGITGANVDLLLGGGQGVDIRSTINTGSGKVTVDGGGTVYLWNANLFTGGVVINSSTTLRALAAGALGPSASATVTFGPGATGILRLESSTQTQTIIGLNTDAGNPGTPVISPLNAWPFRLSQTLIVSNATANTYAGTLADNSTYKLSLTKGAAGTLTLSGNNTYTGTKTINGGTLMAGHANALGTSGTITVNNGGTLGVASGVTFARTVTFNAGSGLGGSGTFNPAAAWTVPATFSLKPGLSTSVTGTLTVDTANNALTAASGTRLEIDFKADGTADKLVVAGTGSLNLSTAGDTLVLKGMIKVGTYVVASAPGGITSTFNTVDKTGLDATSVSVNYPGDGTVVVTKAAAGTAVMIR